MVTTHPPTHCGIGGYGEQNVAQLRAQGHTVDVVSPDSQGNVDFAWDLRGGSKILRLLELAPYYDRIVIQYHWAFFYNDFTMPEFRRDTLKTTLSFIYLFLRSRKIYVVAHEVPYLEWKVTLAVWAAMEIRKCHLPHPGGTRKTGKALSPATERFAGGISAAARGISEVHGAHTSFGAGGIGDSDGRPVFLCIGFIQRHKGFHRAIQAFSKADLKDAHLLRGWLPEIR